MNFKKFKEIKKRIQNSDYYSNWVNIQKGAYIASFAAQAAIIFFGYFYARTIISRANPDLNPVVVMLVAAGFLLVVEILKRAITDKWSKDVVERGVSGRGEFVILSIISLSLYVVSFWFSLNGAREFSDRTRVVQTQAQTSTDQVTDSLNVRYDQRIAVLQEREETLNDQLQNNPTVQAYLEAARQYNERGWRTDLDNRNQLQPQYDRIVERIEDQRDQINQDIQELQAERDSVIAQAQTRIESTTQNTQSEIQDAMTQFKYFTIIFEFMIIGGVFFHRYFYARSMKDFEQRLQNNPKLNRWFRWDQLLDMVYQAKFTPLLQGAKVPKAKELAMMARMEGTNVPENEIQEFYKVLGHIGILDVRGAYKYINMPYDGAKKTLARQFDVETREEF